MTLPILYEDDDLVAINKPPGVVVNRAKSAPGTTIQDWMEERYGLGEGLASGTVAADRSWWSLIPESFDPAYGDPEQVFAARSGMVHRLDKDTSGVLVLGKNPGAMLNLMAQFQARTTYKHYICLVHGLVAQDADTIRLPLGRSIGNRQRFTVTIDGRPAETEFAVRGRYSFNAAALLDTAASLTDGALKELSKKLALYSGFSLLECIPKTGRTHQIRVHLAYLQHPLVGDALYTGKKRAKLDGLWCPRQFLHAAKLGCVHPRTGEQLEWEAPLAADLAAALQYLQPA